MIRTTNHLFVTHDTPTAVTDPLVRQTFWGPLMAGAVSTSLPVVIVFLAIQRNITAGRTAGPGRSEGKLPP